MDEKNPDTGNNIQEKLQILQMPVGLPRWIAASVAVAVLLTLGLTRNRAGSQSHDG